MNRFLLVRVVVWLLRWPLTWWPILTGLYSAGMAQNKAPLQKEFFLPLAHTAWAVLALVPFALLRFPRAYRAYLAAFLPVLGFLCYDLFVPFRYLSPEYLGPGYNGPDWGAGLVLGRIGGAKDQPNLYWVTGVMPPEPANLVFAALLAWSLLLGTAYYCEYQRARRTPLA